MSSPGIDYWYLLMCRVTHEEHEEIKGFLWVPLMNIVGSMI
jgi:hypothetical protein